MPMISEAMLRDLKRGCWMYDCYKCRHVKYYEKECGNEVNVNCKECRKDCACRTCDEGSNWAWDCPVKPLTLEEVQELEDGGIAWVETRDGIVHCMPAMWVKRGKMYTRRLNIPAYVEGRFAQEVEEEQLVTADYGKTWRCWKENPEREAREAAAWIAAE